jgi:osmotically-inducible protein OsmY
VPATGVAEMVERRLRESSYYYLRTISCAFDQGVLTLRGKVPTFYLKQTVQAIAERVEGVQRIINLVDVVNPAGA